MGDGRWSISAGTRRTRTRPDERSEPMLVGETANLAARLQEFAGPGEVVVATATRRLLGAEFTVESLGERQLKGFSEPVEAFRVLAERAVESRFAARTGEALQPMVGREEELALLLHHWRRATAGKGRAVLVVGEAGIGKSRLARALLDAARADRPAVITYEGSPLRRESPFWPVTR